MDNLEKAVNKVTRLSRWWRITLMPTMLLRGYETCDKHSLYGLIVTKGLMCLDWEPFTLDIFVIDEHLN